MSGYADLRGKRVLFMGDSITQLYMGERGWPRYFCELTGVESHACVAVVGSRWCDYPDTVYDGNPIWRINEHCPGNTMCNQVEKVKKLRSEGDERFSGFDLIIIAAGSNDGMPESAEVADAQVYKDGAYVPMSEVDTKTWMGGIRYVTEALYDMYPEARIVLCGPVQADDGIRSFRSILKKGQFLKEAAARMSVGFVDTIHCGICGRYEKWGENGRSLVDGLHPNVNGAKQMARFIASSI